LSRIHLLHQFFNQELQLELKEMRRQLYGQEDPPMPMTFGRRSEAFSRYEGLTLDELKETVEAKPCGPTSTTWQTRSSVSRVRWIGGNYEAC
jgi:hypothetical protein